jgi:hypothetical protein
MLNSGLILVTNVSGSSASILRESFDLKGVHNYTFSTEGQIKGAVRELGNLSVDFSSVIVGAEIKLSRLDRLRKAAQARGIPILLYNRDHQVETNEGLNGLGLPVIHEAQIQQELAKFGWGEAGLPKQSRR